MKLVSVIIPVYNAANTIVDTLNSVFMQDIEKEHIEIIIVNDGSTDSFLDVIEPYKDKIILFNTSNNGVSEARNLGFEKSTGQYIQYLDSDDILCQGKLKKQIEQLQESKADVAYGDWEKIKVVNGSLKVVEKIQREILGDIQIEIFKYFWCPPAAIVYSREVCLKIGSWNTTLPIIQDARYFLDAAIVGAKFIYTPGIMAQYRVNDQNSLSTKSKLSFVKDCFENTKQVYKIWEQDLSVNKYKADVLIDSLRYCLTEFSYYHLPYTNEIIELILKIRPNYIPDKSKVLKYTSMLLGFKKAEKLATLKRKLFKK